MKKNFYLLVYVLFAVVGIFAQTTPESDFTVTLTADNAGVALTKYKGSAATVRIPATIQGMLVREIGNYAFGAIKPLKA
jgi:nitrous oxidase accessory protein NosD